MEGILVTGGLGAVSSPIVGEFESRNHKVCVATLPRSKWDQYYRVDVFEDRRMERVSYDVEDTEETPTYVRDTSKPEEVHDGLRESTMSEMETVVELVPHDETVAELDALGDWLADRGVLAARFTGAELERLTPTQV